MAKGLYTRDEIACMTANALDELLSYYQDTANVEGVLRVTDELGAREDDREAELEREIAEAEAQRLHDEWLDSVPSDRFEDRWADQCEE
jgi:hypothetical protein